MFIFYAVLLVLLVVVEFCILMYLRTFVRFMESFHRCIVLNNEKLTLILRTLDLRICRKLKGNDNGNHETI